MKRLFLFLAIAMLFASCVPSNMAYRKAGSGCPAQYVKEARPSFRN